MLTKDLVCYRNYKNYVNPKFINPNDSELLSIANELIEIFKDSVGSTRAELLENSKMILDGSEKPILVLRGFQKLLLDRTEFDTSTNEKFTNFREEVFTKTSEFLTTQNFENFAEFKAKIESTFSTNFKEISTKLYSDLPEFQEVIKFKKLTPELLLNRYNAAQVQGLLIHCNQLEITVSDSESKRLRQLFKFLRFFQLLAKVEKLDENTFRIFVDGPLNLFYKTQKYGLNLANFFPSLLHQEKWHLVAKVQPKKNRKVYELNLDQSCGIKPISQRFLAYVPKEIQMFQKLFSEKNSNWEILTTSNFVPLEGEAYCFPDFSLKHKNGTELFLEIFHAWHSSHLSERLQTLSLNSPKLILGIAQNLLKDPFLSHSVESSEYFNEFGFTFREMPTVTKVSKILKKFE